MHTMLLATMVNGAVIGVTPEPTVGFEPRETRLKTERYAELAQHLATHDPLRGLAARLDTALRLPAPLGLRYAECGEPSAYYEAATREVVLCLELVERLAQDFGERLSDDRELAVAVHGAQVFIALHEIAHALIDLLSLPITGREEDAADQLSAWLLIGDEQGNAAVLDAAASFSIAADRYAPAEGDLAGEHSLDQQRYYNMVCWVYGSDPEAQSALRLDAGLPAARAERCAEEYERLDRSWSQLLRHYLRGD